METELMDEWGEIQGTFDTNIFKSIVYKIPEQKCEKGKSPQQVGPDVASLGVDTKY